MKGDELKNTDIKRMRALHLLDEKECVIRFYSEYENKYAGNFYTDKRIASYWIDPGNASKNKVFSALYTEVKSLDTVYDAGLTYCSYIRVTRKDGTIFQVCAGERRNDVSLFFEGVFKQWKAHIKQN
ncbi:hypothetical protein SAMN05421788_102381 [Filimonas lacunae]|uniref:Uncharacterized protein n=2 Tax=Filimonas lacunae TaxID=477680 RepID=A0A173MHU2_9BACT|nr:hypothetical protein FLA_3011 [Filimonas lacunae]SIS96757.1 hypothetical protein SAMN05421788_102381 [Filimonas lacunae]